MPPHDQELTSTQALEDVEGRLALHLINEGLDPTPENQRRHLDDMYVILLDNIHRLQSRTIGSYGTKIKLQNDMLKAIQIRRILASLEGK